MARVIGKDTRIFKTCTCGNCASIIEYTLGEVSTSTSTDYTGDSETEYYIICPQLQCKRQVRVFPYSN